MPTDETDILTIRQAMEGDEDSFGRLVDRHYARVFAHTLLRTGDRSAAEEIAQETFLKGFISIRRLRETSSFPAWLFAICNNEIRLHWHRRSRGACGWNPEEVAEVACPPPEDLRETKNELLKAIETLPDNGREVILLRYFAGCSLRGIASLTGVPEARVRSRLFEARRQLKRILEAGTAGLPTIDRQTHLQRRHGIMNKWKMIRHGAYLIPRLSLARQTDLLAAGLENAPFPEELLAELGSLQGGRDFVCECSGRLSRSDLVHILACCDNGTVYRIQEATGKIQAGSGFDLLKALNEHLGAAYSVIKVDVCLHVPAIETSQAWYRDVLGWKGGVDAQDDSGEGCFGCMYLDDLDGLTQGSRVFSGLYFRRAEPRFSGTAEVFITVTGIENLRAHILESGWKQVSEIQDEGWGARTLYVTDPDGIRLMFLDWGHPAWHFNQTTEV